MLAIFFRVQQGNELSALEKSARILLFDVCDLRFFFSVCLCREELGEIR